MKDANCRSLFMGTAPAGLFISPEEMERQWQVSGNDTVHTQADHAPDIRFGNNRPNVNFFPGGVNTFNQAGVQVPEVWMQGGVTSAAPRKRAAPSGLGPGSRRDA